MNHAESLGRPDDPNRRMPHRLQYRGIIFPQCSRLLARSRGCGEDASINRLSASATFGTRR